MNPLSETLDRVGKLCRWWLIADNGEFHFCLSWGGIEIRGNGDTCREAWNNMLGQLGKYEDTNHPGFHALRELCEDEEKDNQC